MLRSPGRGQVLGSQVSNRMFLILLVQRLGWVFETQERKKEKREFKNGHISRFFCFSSKPSNLVGKVLQKKTSRCWPQLHFMNDVSCRDFKVFFLEKRSWKSFSIQCSNSGINDSTLQTQSNVSWIANKTEIMIFLNSDLEISLLESGREIGPATGVTLMRKKVSKTLIF